MILSSLFGGTILSQIPCGILIQKYGPKVILCSALFSQAVIMALSPLAVVHGVLNSDLEVIRHLPIRSNFIFNNSRWSWITGITIFDGDITRTFSS